MTNKTKNKLKLWNEHETWEEAEKTWTERSEQAQKNHPIKGLKRLPNMVGMTPDTAKGLKWKSLKWMLLQDRGWKITKSFFRHPLRYGWNFLKSIVKTQSYTIDDDFFFYGFSDVDNFKQELQKPDVLVAIGFSYCHKPFECPSKRFTDECIHDLENPTCQQCFIGKCMHALPDEKVVSLIIPDIHYIGGKMFDLVHANPKKKVLFLITACEMTLKMFGDWGNMADIRGIGVRLDGRICNTMRAFELSERGIKPGLTVVTNPTQERILELIRYLREDCRSSS